MIAAIVGAALTDATTPFGSRTGIALATSVRSVQYPMPMYPPIAGLMSNTKIAVAAATAATATHARIRPRTFAFIG
jgi:hypothetical protein